MILLRGARYSGVVEAREDLGLIFPIEFAGRGPLLAPSHHQITKMARGMSICLRCRSIPGAGEDRKVGSAVDFAVKQTIHSEDSGGVLFQEDHLWQAVQIIIFLGAIHSYRDRQVA